MADTGSRTLTHYEIVVKYEQYLLAKNLILDKVVPLAVKRGILKPKLGERLQKSDTSLFLAVLKNKSVQVFVEFLQCLAETFPSCKEHQSLVKTMSPDLLRVNNAPPELLSIVEDIVAAAEAGEVVSPTAQQTRLGETATVQSSGLQEIPAGDFERISLVSKSGAPGVKETSTISPPGGFIEPCLSKLFGREGGVFYCSSHGLDINIPPGAILPSEPDGRFMIFMHAYIKGPFHIPATMDVDPFTAVFLLNVYPPQQKFQKPINVRMPHCAIVDDNSEFVVLRGSRPCDSTSDSYEFSEVLEADCLEDGYHLEVSIDHFSPFVGCRRRLSEQKQGKSHQIESPRRSSPLRQRRLRNSDEQTTSAIPKDVRQTFSAKKHSSDGSLERSSVPLSDKQGRYEEISAGVETPLRGDGQPGGPVGAERVLNVNEGPSCELCVAKWRPQICGQSWEEVFLVAGAHPTGRLALKNEIQNLEIGTGRPCETAPLFGSNVVCVYSVSVVDDFLEFSPESWEDDDWKVMAQITPKIPVREVISPHLFGDQSDIYNYVSRRDYRVQQHGNRNPEHLSCKISVKGATMGGTLLYFMISYPASFPTSPTLALATDTVSVWSSLYSQIPAALQNRTESTLGTLTEDLCRLLADMSFQLPGRHRRALLPRLVTREAERDRIEEKHPQDKTEQFYRMLHACASRQPHTSLQDFFDFAGIAVTVIADSDCERGAGQSFSTLNFDFSSASVDGQPTSNFVCILARKVVTQRWVLARFLGVDGDMIRESCMDNPNDQSIKLLQAWRSEKGHDASGGVLARTIYWLFELDSRMCDAWEYVRKVNVNL